jgi:hypothetical protein
LESANDKRRPDGAGAGGPTGREFDSKRYRRGPAPADFGDSSEYDAGGSIEYDAKIAAETRLECWSPDAIGEDDDGDAAGAPSATVYVDGHAVRYPASPLANMERLVRTIVTQGMPELGLEAGTRAFYVGGALEDRTETRAGNALKYPDGTKPWQNGGLFEPFTFKIAGGMPSPASGASTEQQLIEGVGDVTGAEAANTRLIVPPAEHRKATPTRPASCYLKVVKRTAGTTKAAFKDSWVEFTLANSDRYKHNLRALGLDAYSQGTDARSMRTDANSLGSDAYSQGTDAYSQGTDAFSQGTDARSMRTDAYSMRTDARSMGTDAYSMRTDARSMGTDAHSLGASAYALGVSAFSVGTAKKDRARGADRQTAACWYCKVNHADDPCGLKAMRHCPKRAREYPEWQISGTDKARFLDLVSEGKKPGGSK